MKISQQSIEPQPGKKILKYTLDNGRMSADIINLGGSVLSIKVPDKNGRQDDIVLGYGRLEDYFENPDSFGCIVGRFANRIAKGTFVLNEKTYSLARNEGNNHLHGGTKGFNKYIWDSNAESGTLVLKRLSPNGEEGFPGNLKTTVKYSLSDENELVIEYIARSDADTVVNLTNHSYFNLKGHKAGDITGHYLKIYADSYTPINSEGIPTGKILPVDNSPFDFRKSKRIGSDIDMDNEQLLNGSGYDHNFVINKEGFKIAAEVYEPSAGRLMTVFTTMPGIQFYTGNMLHGSKGKDGANYLKRHGFCLETQYFPDTPNQPSFPSCILRKGEVYRHKTAYKFSCK